VQRSCFFKFKKGIPLAAKSAFKLSAVAIILEVVLLEIIPCPFIKCITLVRGRSSRSRLWFLFPVMLSCSYGKWLILFIGLVFFTFTLV
jgi:hypothetical protein